jgi:hypothetical protein
MSVMRKLLMLPVTIPLAAVRGAAVAALKTAPLAVVRGAAEAALKTMQDALADWADGEPSGSPVASTPRAEPQAPPAPPRATSPPPPVQPSADEPTRAEVGRRRVAEREAEGGGPGGVGAEVHIDEPWDGYDRMTAQEVVERLIGADEATLAVVRLYEAANRNRVTVLRATET